MAIEMTLAERVLALVRDPSDAVLRAPDLVSEGVGLVM